MKLSDFDMERWRSEVIRAAKDEDLDLDDLLPWPLAEGWPKESRGRLWRAVGAMPELPKNLREDAEGTRMLCQILSDLHDADGSSPWWLLPGREFGEIWVVWPVVEEGDDVTGEN